MFKFGNKAKIAATSSDATSRNTSGSADNSRPGLLSPIENFLQKDQFSVNSCKLILSEAKSLNNNAVLNYPADAHRGAAETIIEPSLDDWAGNVASRRDNGAKPDPAEGQIAREELNMLIGKLDQSLQEFARNASDACSAASDYHAALFETATSLEAIRPVVEMTALSELTRAMIERTRTVEAEMRRREAEAASLRQSLPLARADDTVNHLAGSDDRRAFAAVLDSEVRAAREAGEPLSIALCGIDGFKAITDTHGQDAGDRVIQAIARVMQRISGQNCQIARHDSEAFVLLFRGFMPDEAGTQLNHAREKFAQRKLVDRKTHSAIGTVTFSGGVADALAYADPREALKAADEALQAAREQGRSRIVVARKTNDHQS